MKLAIYIIGQLRSIEQNQEQLKKIYLAGFDNYDVFCHTSCDRALYYESYIDSTHIDPEKEILKFFGKNDIKWLWNDTYNKDEEEFEKIYLKLLNIAAEKKIVISGTKCGIYTKYRIYKTMLARMEYEKKFEIHYDKIMILRTDIANCIPIYKYPEIHQDIFLATADLFFFGSPRDIDILSNLILHYFEINSDGPQSPEIQVSNWLNYNNIKYHIIYSTFFVRDSFLGLADGFIDIKTGRAKESMSLPPLSMRDPIYEYRNIFPEFYSKYRIKKSVPLRIIIPMAGKNRRFYDYGFKTPKYSLPMDIDQTTMIEKAIVSLTPPIGTEMIFITYEVCRNDQTDNLRNLLMGICKKYNWSCNIVAVSEITDGPASSCYEARHLIDDDVPLIISNCDQVLEYQCDKFLNKCSQYDGCVLTYDPPYPVIIGEQDKHSYIGFKDDKISQFSEKTVLSKIALVGVHYYAKGSYFVSSYIDMVTHQEKAPNGEYYISLTYNAMLRLGHTIGYHHLTDNEHFYPTGIPFDYFLYLEKTNSMKLEKYPLSNNVFFQNDGVCISILRNNKGSTINLNNKICLLVSGIISINGEIIDKDNIFSGEFSINIIENSIIIAVDIINKNINIIRNHLDNMIRDWYIGDFYPAVYRTDEFEIALLRIKKDASHDFHYHKKAKEYNLLISGKMMINNYTIDPNDIFIFREGEISCPKFNEDCIVLCLKIPSCPTDKYII